MRKYMSRSKQIIYLCNLTMSVQVTKFLCEMFSDCKVFGSKRSGKKVLLRFLVHKANFQKRDVSPGYNTNGRRGDRGNDALSPTLFIVRGEGYESRVVGGGGWKTLGSSELLQVNCAFHREECGGL